MIAYGEVWPKRGPDGSAASPTYSFANEPDCGARIAATNIMALTAGGSDIVGICLGGSGINNGVRLRSSVTLSWSSATNVTSTPDVVMERQAAGSLALHNVTSSSAQLSIFSTRPDASNGEWLDAVWASNIANIRTNANGTGTQRALRMGAGGTSFWEYPTSGHYLAVTDNASDLGAAGATRPRSGFFGTSVSVGDNPAAAGAIRLANNVAISARNAANSADIPIVAVDGSNVIQISSGGAVVNFGGAITCAGLTFSGALVGGEQYGSTSSGGNYALDSTSHATKGTITFGTGATSIVIGSTTGLISMYGGTPITRGAAVADAAGGATVDAEARTAINALLARVRAINMIAT